MHSPSEEQRKIILSDAPVISLKSPGGTGKTETLAWYVMGQMDRHNHIVLITYTNSAADNMKNLIRRSIYFNNNLHFIGTIHAFAKRILHIHADKIGYKKDFKLEPGITENILKKLIKIHDRLLTSIDDPFKTIQFINNLFLKSNHKFDSIVKGVRKEIDTDNIKIIRDIISKLKREKRRMNVMDFDDLPYYFYLLLKNNQAMFQSLSKKYTLMIVDEFQDTTEIQWKSMKLLIENRMRFLGAGDPYQTLYRFAGASTGRFQQLEALAECTSFELIHNHRSTKQIIDLSNQIRRQLNVEVNSCSNEFGPKPQVLLSHQKGLLIKAILKKIDTHIQEGVSLDDMAVTYRFNRDANLVIKILNREKIPYKLFGSEKRSTSKLTEFVISIMKISLNQGDGKQWRNVLSLLKGVGSKNIETILRYLKKWDFRYRCLKNLKESRYKEELLKLKDLFLQAAALKEEPVKAINTVINFYGGLQKTKKIVVNDPHVATIINIARVSRDVQEFVLNCNDSSYAEYHPIRNGNMTQGFLTLSTIHKIKGKGFKVVFVLGSYDNQFKAHDIFGKEESIRDEIMVMDTAVTRSKQYLYFLFPMTHKDWEMQAHKQNSSVFIRNCPKGLYDVYTVG